MFDGGSEIPALASLRLSRDACLDSAADGRRGFRGIIRISGIRSDSPAGAPERADVDTR